MIACVPKKVHNDDGSEGEFLISGEEIEEVIIEGLSENVDPEPEVPTAPSAIKNLSANKSWLSMACRLRSLPTLYPLSTCLPCGRQ